MILLHHQFLHQLVDLYYLHQFYKDYHHLVHSNNKHSRIRNSSSNNNNNNNNRMLSNRSSNNHHHYHHHLLSKSLLIKSNRHKNNLTINCLNLLDLKLPFLKVILTQRILKNTNNKRKCI